MAINVRKVDTAMIFGLVAAYQDMAKALAVANSKAHADITAASQGGDYKSPTTTALQVTVTNATDTNSAITLFADLKAKLNTHVADAIAHSTADTTNTVTTAAPTDLTTAIAAVNAYKATYNAHCSQSGVHFTNDATNTIATANATDSPTLVTLVNACKTSTNAHIKFGLSGLWPNLVAP